MAKNGTSRTHHRALHIDGAESGAQFSQLRCDGKEIPSSFPTRSVTGWSSEQFQSCVAEKRKTGPPPASCRFQERSLSKRSFGGWFLNDILDGEPDEVRTGYCRARSHSFLKTSLSPPEEVKQEEKAGVASCAHVAGTQRQTMNGTSSRIASSYVNVTVGVLPSRGPKSRDAWLRQAPSAQGGSTS